jgi:hypothetical protein
MAGQNDLLSALQAQHGLQNQSQVYNQYQNLAAGQGPNPAQAMLNQATGQNVSNQAALMAGQRGAGSNVGLMARQAGQQGAQIQQQAAGQGASMQAQQALNAIGQAGGMANTMASNQIGQTNANVQAQQNEQNMLLNANQAQNNIQGQLANTGMQGQQKVVGGLMNAAGLVGGLAEGGEVSGSAFGPQSMFGQFVTSGSPSTPSFGGDNSGGQIGDKWGKKQKKQKTADDPMAGAQDITPTSDVPRIPAAAHGGQIKGVHKVNIPTATPFLGESKAGEMVRESDIHPNKMKEAKSEHHRVLGEMKAMPKPKIQGIAKGGNVGSQLKAGGHVPGQAQVKGNDYKNDTVKALLSPGEVVIPRSVMQGKDPVRGAAEFVRSVMAKKGKRA